MEIQGKIIAALDKKSGTSQSGKEWCAQEYVIETGGDFPKKCCFSVFGEDKISEFGLKVGDVCKVFVDIDARQYKDRWYNSIKAYNIERSDSKTQNSNFEPPFVPREVKKEPDENQFPF